MIAYIIPTLVVVLPSAGFIAGALFAGSRRREEIADLLAWKASVLSGLNRASAARKSKRIAKEEADKALRDARHGKRETLELI